MGKAKWWKRWVVGVLVGWILLIYILFCLMPFRLDLNRGESFALAQVAIEAVLLPLALLGFGWTYLEIKYTLSPAMLDLGWDEGDGVPPKHTAISDEPTEDAEREGKAICVYNSGSNAVRWFVIQMKLPSGICINEPDVGFTLPDSWEPSSGTDGGAWHKVSEGDSLRVTFTSNGNVASFPGLRLQLGTVWHLSGNVGMGEHSVVYSIHTERGEPIRGALKMVVKSLWE